MTSNWVLPDVRRRVGYLTVNFIGEKGITIFVQIFHKIMFLVIFHPKLQFYINSTKTFYIKIK
jgi:hypothetical protein